MSKLILGKIPEDVHQKAGRAILSFSTPILGLKTDDPNEPPILLGSATFIKYGKDRGLLTAQHTIDRTDYYKCLSIGLAISSAEHRFTIPRKYLKEKVSTPRLPEYGPDLAYIRIPVMDAGKIEARKSFWHMDTNLKRIPKALEIRNTGIWIIFGCPAEYQSSTSSQSFFERTFIPGALAALSSKPRFLVKKTYDYFDVTASYEIDNNLPGTFSGMSGGGLWFVPLSKTSDKSEEIQVHHPILMGLAFYQTDVNDCSRIIRCHGPKSIYVKMQNILENEQ
jgi:hypothetical protein